ncbi:right-handed parallel beta-helix repeat-containing protein [Microbulbifer epialgicus]|uniref:Right-handed parallel beta-helix repeat-containing protein n=1 Tax=Microbulbifer epialgicus TaxID=393907 RepID=A0ABV4P5Y3_9GAMM
MKSKKIHPVKSAFIVLAGAIGMSLSGMTLAVSCGDTIDTPEALDSDLNCAVSPAVTIMGPSGSLNFNGFTISCDGDGVGVKLVGSMARITGGGTPFGFVQLCDTGVFLEGTGSHYVSDISADQNSRIGISMVSDGNFLLDSQGSNNSGIGIAVSGDNNTIAASSANNNQLDGIAVVGNGAVIARSFAITNSLAGIVLSGSDNSVVTQNTATSNTYGIVLERQGQGNFIIANDANTNFSTDLVDDNVPPCVGNTWFLNDFVTASDPCIN